MSDRSPRASIRGILLRSLGLVAVVPFLPLGVLIFLGYRDDVERVEGEIQTTNRQIAILAAHYLDRFLRATRAEATLAASKGGAELPAATSDVRWELVGADGVLIASQVDAARVGRDGGYGGILACPGWERSTLVTPVGGWVAGLPPTVLIAARVSGAGGGAVVGVLRPEGLHEELTASLGAAVDRRVYVVDRQGRPLFYSDLGLAGRAEDIATNPPVRLFRDGGSGPIRYRSRVTDKERLGFVQPVPGGQLAAIVSADIGEAVIGLRDRYLVVTWSILFALVAVAGLGAWTSRRLLRPLLRIRDALRDEGAGERKPLAVPAGELGTVEYADLVRAFDELESRLAVSEAGLLQAEKSALLGQLATGIAHEFGTPLNVISGNAQVLMRKLDAGDPRREVLEKIVRQSQRLAAMIRRVLDFARPTEPQLRRVDLGRVVAQALEMAAGMMRKVAVETRIASGTPPVEGDPHLLEHALLNLVVNAYQAMVDGGKLTVEAGPEDTTAPEAGREQVRRAGGQPGAYLRVMDTGPGIPEQDLPRIFEPFFTTKPQGEGTGLGLAIVRRIVRQHGGRIDVHSRVGEGTTFTIVLRRAQEGPEESEVER
ncbi:MAG: hypothetical protein HY907_01045 [Deltaproteobacteria bacterium]|nr:hypothetical protein [Deltaproteobacteria bacterium]